jgi:hypothetical protein
MARNSVMLVEAATSFHPDATTMTGGDESLPMAVLDPVFAAWLMGWPDRWQSACGLPNSTSSAMVSVPSLSQWRLSSSLTVQASLKRLGYRWKVPDD